MFYTIIVTNAQTIYAFPTKTQAIERFHSELAYAMNQNIKCMCMVIDEHGAVYKSEEFIPTEE